MAYTVELKPAAVRDLKAIPERDRKRIKTRIDALAENPRPHGVKALQGAEGYLRLRVGDYRIIYTVLDQGAPGSRESASATGARSIGGEAAAPSSLLSSASALPCCGRMTPDFLTLSTRKQG